MMGETWLTGDLHGQHPMVAKLRGFDTAEGHDQTVLGNIARKVKDRDRLFVLGDVVMGADKESYLRRLRATVGPDVELVAVLGNHDRPHPMHRNAHAHLAGWLKYFDSVVTAATVRHGGATYLLSHFPYDGEGVTRAGDADRHTQWRLHDEGTPLFHAHVHDLIRHRLSTWGTPMIHVGLDAWNLAPVTIHDAITGGVTGP